MYFLFTIVRGVFLAKGPDSSLGGVPVGKLPWRRPHGGRGSGQGPGRSGKRRARDRRDTRKGTRRGTESQRTDTQTHNMDDHGDDMPLSQCGVSHIMKHVRCAGEKVTCEVYLSTHPVGYCKLLSSVKETYCNKQFFKMNWTSWVPPAFGRVPVPPGITRGRRVPSRYCWGEMGCATSSPILDGDGFWLWLQVECLIQVASAHSCPTYSMWDTIVLGISWIPLWRDGTCDLLVPTCPSRCTSARSSHFWVANHDRLGLLENDRGFLCNVLLERQRKSAWSASRWGWLSIFFMSSWTRKISACFTTACGNPDTLESMSISSHCVNKPMYCSLFTGLSVLIWSAPTFFVCVFVFVYKFNRHWHTTLDGWWSIHRSHRSWVCAFATTQDIFSDLLSERTRWLLTLGSPRSW